MTDSSAPPSGLLSLIVPTYNEAESLGPLVRGVEAALTDVPHEILICDDDSPDGTARVAEALTKGGAPVTVVSRRGDRDLSRAVMTGMTRARGTIIAVMDADLSHPPSLLPTLLTSMQETRADIVVASRLVPGGGTEGWPAKRKMSSYVGTLLARPLTSVRDPLSGFFLLRASILAGLDLRPKGYKILLEILVKAPHAKIVEVPFVFRDRSAGTSKLGLRANLSYLAQIAHLYPYVLLRRRRTGPTGA